MKINIPFTVCLLLCLGAMLALTPLSPVLPPGAEKLEASAQRPGDPEKGYHYLIYGDYISSGVPLGIFRQGFKNTHFDLGRTGDASGIPYDYNVVTTAEGAKVVSPNCLTCHAEMLNGELVIGLGNNSADHTEYNTGQVNAAAMATRLKYGKKSPEFTAYLPIKRSHEAVGPYILTKVRGSNPADKIFAALAAHRNASDLSWLPKKQFDTPLETVPTDVPAWWLMKKKNALYYNGLGRGDFARLSSASGMLTIKDSSEARRIDARFPDVMAWIRTLEAPKYPYPIDTNLAEKGKMIFEKNCSKCHGSYGDSVTYPNLLIRLDKIGTDSMLALTYQRYPEYHNWYNNSWYGQGPYAGRLAPNYGYVAPPLDGVWATAPYLHNGSVPTLDDLLNSPQRPAYWKRNFKNNEYDTEKGGWKYTRLEKATDDLTYNSTLPGYGNYGHRFGDKLSAEDRKAVVEYLKRL